jgi:hypothetical protein
MAGAVALEVSTPFTVRVELLLFAIPGLYATLPPVTDPFTVTAALLADIKIPAPWPADSVLTPVEPPVTAPEWLNVPLPETTIAPLLALAATLLGPTIVPVVFRVPDPESATRPLVAI